MTNFILECLEAECCLGNEYKGVSMWMKASNSSSWGMGGDDERHDDLMRYMRGSVGTLEIT